MSFIIYKMEMKRNLKLFLIWSLSLAGVLLLGMLFYPAISADGLLTQMDSLFENPMMSGVMKAFGVADISSLGSLMGFYVTYNSMYNILLGCIFAAILAGNLLAKEEANKTAEFLFTRPVSRATIFWSKSAVMVTYLFILAIVFFLVSIMAMEVVKGDSPRQLDISRRQKALLIKQIQLHPDVIYDAFDLDKDSFDDYSLTFASNLLLSSGDEIKEMNLNPEDMNRLLKEAAGGPEAFFNNVEKNPEKYMAIFNISADGRDEFIKNIEKERSQYLEMKQSFFNSPELFISFLEEDPALALSRFASKEGAMGRTLGLLEIDPDFENRIFSPYSVAKLAQISLYFFLLICTVSSLVLTLSLLIKRGKSNTGMALGLVFFFYFINSLHAITKNFPSIISKIGYISPFTWIDTDIYRMGFVVDFWRVALFVGVSVVGFIIGERLLNRKDILV